MENRGRRDFRSVDGADTGGPDQHDHACRSADRALLFGDPVLQMAQ